MSAESTSKEVKQLSASDAIGAALGTLSALFVGQLKDPHMREWLTVCIPAVTVIGSLISKTIIRISLDRYAKYKIEQATDELVQGVKAVIEDPSHSPDIKERARKFRDNAVILRLEHHEKNLNKALERSASSDKPKNNG